MKIITKTNHPLNGVGACDADGANDGAGGEYDAVIVFSLSGWFFDGAVAAGGRPACRQAFAARREPARLRRPPPPPVPPRPHPQTPQLPPAARR
jgi:hypothetical protein